jgi:hypothetical protein
MSGNGYKLFQRSENLEKSIDYYFDQIRVHLDRIEDNSRRKSDVDLINAIQEPVKALGNELKQQLNEISKEVQEARSSERLEKDFSESEDEKGEESDIKFGDSESSDEDKEIATVEKEPLKRRICRAIVESETGAELDDKLMKMDIMLGRNGEDTESNDSLDILDNMINRRFYPRARAFTCPFCFMECEKEAEMATHLLLEHHESEENIEEKSIYWLYGKFCIDFCLLDGQVCEFENTLFNTWRCRKLNYRKYFLTKGEREKS